MFIFNRTWVFYPIVLALILAAVSLSGCTFWVKDIDGNTYKTIIPDARVDQRVHFFLDRFSTNVKKLFSVISNYRLRRLLIKTNTSFHELIQNIGKNSPSNPADIYTLYKNTEKLVQAIKKELKRERSRIKRNHLSHALSYTRKLLSLIVDFNSLALIQDP